MIGFSMLISNDEILNFNATGPGGLFDINATLPLVAIQFLILMIVLNLILFTPLLAVIEERNEYILTYLSKASELVSEADKLTNQYEQELGAIRKSAQLEITTAQNVHKEILEIELNISQKYIDNLLDTIINDFEGKKNTALENLNDIVQTLCTDIETRLSI